MNKPSNTLSAGTVISHNGALGLVIAGIDQAGLLEIATLEPVSGDSRIGTVVLSQADFVGEATALSTMLQVNCVELRRVAAHELDQKGRLSEAACDRVLRAIVHHGVERYYTAIHRPRAEASFSPGDRISYAGRVFDSREMLNLSESMLDFWLTSGRFCDEFERTFAKTLGVRFAALVNSGSSANLIAFSALTSPLLKERAIRPGDEVITVAAGFPTTVTPVLHNRCIPVFVDITLDDGCYNIDVTKLEAALSPKTKAIMVAHTLGNPINLDAVTAFCKKHNLWLVEDNCDALGSRYRGQLTGTFGDVATSSFYPPHHLTMGEGGAVYSKSLVLKRAVESLRDWGRDCWCPAGKDNTCGVRFGQQLGTLPHGYDHKYVYSHAGYNLKATDLQASIGLAQLEKLPAFIEARRRNWQTLRDGCRDLEEHFILPAATEHSEPSWFGFLLTLRESSGKARTDIVRFLESRNIQTRMLFAGNLLRQPFLARETEGEAYRVVGELTNTDRVMNQTFWIGVYPGLRPGMTEYMLESLRDAVRL